MPPKDLERATTMFRCPELAPAPLLPAAFAIELRKRLDAIERRHRRHQFLDIVKAFASHLVLEGDEPSDESN